MSEKWKESWKVIESVGSGGQGFTRRVTNLIDPEKHGVLKTLRDNKKKSPQARGRMHREATALGTLGNAGVKVPALLDGNTKEYADLEVSLYFVMEFIPGVSLQEYIKSTRLPLDVAVAFINDLCSVVADAHRNDVVHRDLKPDNIIVRSAEKADLVIVDYGLSFNQRNDDGLTVVDEQFRNSFLALPETNTFGTDQRSGCSDVTALCAIFYFCLTGHSPGQLRDGTGKAPHRRPGFTIADAVKGHQCEQIELLFDRAFAVEMQSRFQTCGDFLQRLKVATSAAPPPMEDLATISNRVTAKLRETNRETQLSMYAAPCSKVRSDFNEYYRVARKQLGPHFDLNVGNITIKDLQQHTPGYDLIGHQIAVTVTLNPQKYTYRIVYGTWAQGLQCVLKRKFGMHKGPINTAPIASGDWEDLEWFDPLQPPPASRFKPFLETDLTKAVAELAKLAE